MKEAHFLTEWRESLEYWFPGCFAYKIPDQPRFAAEQIKFAVPRPFDMFMVYKGIFVAFEAKLMKSLTGFSFDKLADNQRHYLQKVKQASGHAYVVINYRCPVVPEKTKKKFNIETNRYSVAIMFDIDQFLEIEKLVSGNSLPFDKALEFGYKVYRDEGRWNLFEWSHKLGF